MSNHLVSYPTLVGERMSGGNKVISGHVPSFYRDDKDVHLLGNVLMTEDWICSSKREPSTHLLEEEMEGKEEVEREREEKVDEEEVDGEEKDRKEEEGEVDDGEEGDAVALGSSGDGYRPFILPSIWLVNDFLSNMSKKVFGNLHPCFQIPDNVPIRMAGKDKSVTLARLRTSASTRSSSLRG